MRPARGEDISSPLFSPGHANPLTNNSASFSLLTKIKLLCPSFVILAGTRPTQQEPIMNWLSRLVAHFSKGFSGTCRDNNNNKIRLFSWAATPITRDWICSMSSQIGSGPIHFCFIHCRTESATTEAFTAVTFIGFGNKNRQKNEIK